MNARRARVHVFAWFPDASEGHHASLGAEDCIYELVLSRTVLYTAYFSPFLLL